jgi:hypothetical protein
MPKFILFSMIKIISFSLIEQCLRMCLGSVILLKKSFKCNKTEFDRTKLKKTSNILNIKFCDSTNSCLIRCSIRFDKGEKNLEFFCTILNRRNNKMFAIKNTLYLKIYFIQTPLLLLFSKISNSICSILYKI